jgi:uroporphyrinogen decarboxylase
MTSTGSKRERLEAAIRGEVTPASSFCLLDWGVRDEWQGNTEGTREYTKRVILEPRDWTKLDILSPEQGGLGDQLECLRALRDELGDEVPIIQTVFSPLAQAKNLAGGNRLIEHLHRDPEAVLAGLKIISATTAAWVERLKDVAVDGVFYAVQHASYRYFDSAGYEKYGVPFDLQVLERAAEFWLNILHLHGEAIHFELAGRFPVQIVNWHDREVEPDLAAGGSQFSGAVCGGVRRDTLIYGNPETVAAEAHESIFLTGGKGMILGTGCVTPIIAPRTNLQALRDAVNFA